MFKILCNSHQKWFRRNICVSWPACPLLFDKEFCNNVRINSIYVYVANEIQHSMRKTKLLTTELFDNVYLYISVDFVILHFFMDPKTYWSEDESNTLICSEKVYLVQDKPLYYTVLKPSWLNSAAEIGLVWLPRLNCPASDCQLLAGTNILTSHRSSTLFGHSLGGMSATYHIHFQSHPKLSHH